MYPYIQSPKGLDRMEPFGIMVTMMRWNDPLLWVFNAGLFLWQLTMLVIFKIINKFMWKFMPSKVKIIFNYSFKQLLQASFSCHVRLVRHIISEGRAVMMTFSYPEAHLDTWRPAFINGCNKRFIYRKPTFGYDSADLTIMRDETDAILSNPVKKKYDWLQIASFCINLPIWILWWPAWGKQVIPIFNLKGERQVCSSGILLILRLLTGAFKVYHTFCTLWDVGWHYVTAMACPALFLLSMRWETVEELEVT